MDWIKCSDQMPEENVKVLVYWKNSEGNGKGVYIDYISYPKDGNIWELGTKEMIYYWMPLPKPPEE